MYVGRPVLVVTVTILLLASAPGTNAQPRIPATFFGSATIDGEPVDDGTEIRAFIGKIDCTQAPTGEGGTILADDAAAYAIVVVHESQRPGCGADNIVISFTIDGRPARETSTWQAIVRRLDLTSDTGSSPTVINAPSDTRNVSQITDAQEIHVAPSPESSLAINQLSNRVQPSRLDPPAAGSTSPPLTLSVAIGAVVLAVVGIVWGLTRSQLREER